MVERLHARVSQVPLLVGFVDRNRGRGKPFHNAAALLKAGEPLRKIYKSLLPTYDVFDEDRYFEPGCDGETYLIAGRKVGVTICEDIWTEHYLPRPLYDVEPVRGLVEKGAEIIVNLSASPFSLHKPAVRREMVGALAVAYRCPICYCNAVGGNDQLVLDGNSIAVNPAGDLIAQLPAFRDAEAIVDTESSAVLTARPPDDAGELFGALSLGVRDYLAKCNFKSAVLGLSGGIDSAVVAAIAVDALGASNVVGVSMPSPYSSRGSIDDALALAKNLGIKCLEIPIGWPSTFLKRNSHDFRRIAGRCHRREHAISTARNDPHVALEQIRSSASHHETRASSRLAIAPSTETWPAGWRHQRRPENARLSSRALDQSRPRNHPRIHHRKAAECGIETKPDGPGHSPTL
jgi:predicted amidohydrolase